MTTLTLGEADRAESERLQSAFFSDAVVQYRGRPVRVVREFKDQSDRGWIWTFELVAV